MNTIIDQKLARAVPAHADLIKSASIALRPFPIPEPAQSDALATGLHGAIGCDFIPATNQLAFVEFNGNVSLLNLVQPLVTKVSQGTVTLKGTWIFDCETGLLSGALSGPGDIWWDQQTNTQRQMVPTSGARIVNLGHINFDTLSSAALQSLAYGTTPIAGNNDASNQLTTGDVFAVATNAGNFCKIQVIAYGYDMQIRYETCKVGSRYRVLGTGYDQPEDIVVRPDGVHAFVTERSGNILKVDLTNASRAAAHVLVAGLKAPHQMVFDAGHAHLYVVEFDGGRLLKVDADTGAMAAPITTALDHPIGIALSADGLSAYVSEQAAGGGRVRRVDLSTGAISDVASGLTAPFMMTWLDDAKQRLALTERDPANRVAIIDLGNANTITRVSNGIAFRPSHLAMVSPTRALVTCDAEIDDLLFGGSPLTGPLYKGIGFVPFDRIDAVTGLADTSVDPGYFYQVKQVPFGSVLPIRINHYLASIDGAAWYQVLFDGVPRGDAWGDYKWNPATNRYDFVTITPQNVVGHTNLYPVRNLGDLVLYYNSDLGSRVDTTSYADGFHTIEIRLFNAVGGPLVVGPPSGGAHRILLDNSACFASLDDITCDGQSAGVDCGILKYVNLTDSVTMKYRASQPHNSATFTFRVLRGAHEIVSLEQGGDVAAPNHTESASAGTLLGTCAAPGGPGVAGFLEELYVATKAINGEGRCSGYDASDARAFVLSK